jgi:CRISPR-associated protein Cmr3
MLFVEPVDAWSFRDGKPFEAGESFEAGSVFPPAPWTTLGFVRTTLLRGLCGDPERYAGRPLGGSCPRCGAGPCHALEKVGPPSGAPPFEVGPPLPAVCRQGGACEVFYPAPADLAEAIDPVEGATTLVRLKPLGLPEGARHSLGGLQPVGLIGHHRLSPARERWLSSAELSAHLAGEATAPTGTAVQVYRDARIGVGIEGATRAVRTGQLYIRDVVQLSEGWGLAIRTDRSLGLEAAVGRLGGDGRMARIREREAPEQPALATVERRFRLYLAAPTWLQHGHIPGFMDDKSLEGSLPEAGTPLKLIAAALAPTVAIGGWDLALQQPRPIRQMVGAGSVYFFEAADAAGANAAAAALHGRRLCDDPDMAKAGFGLCFAGRY